MNNRFKSLAGLDENATLSPTPQADPDQLICVNTTNPSNREYEAADKNVQMSEIIDTSIVPCVPIYGLFTQTPSQIKNANLLFALFSEYEDKMPVETSITTKEGTETTTSSAVELVKA